MELRTILVVDDDLDDLEFIRDCSVRNNTPYPVKLLQSGRELVSYLQTTTTPPFLILSDVNMPVENGFELKKRILEDAELKYGSVPFVFWSTGAAEQRVNYPQSLIAEGLFQKPTDFGELCKTFKTIVDYWERSQPSPPSSKNR